MGEAASFGYRIAIPEEDERHTRVRPEVVINLMDQRDQLVRIFIDLTGIKRSHTTLATALKQHQAVIKQASHSINKRFGMMCGAIARAA